MSSPSLRTKKRAAKAVTKPDEALEKFGHLVPKVLSSLNLPPHADFEDLLSVGRIALMQAAAQLRSDATAEPYLRMRVRGAMLDYIRDVTWIPRGTLERKRKLDGAVAELEMKHGRVPHDHEIARQLGMGLSEFAEWQTRAQVYSIVSAHGGASANGDGDGDLLNNVADERAIDPAAEFEKQDLVEAIFRAIQQLPRKLQQVLALYYHEELQMQEIARVLEVTESRVSQMHSQAIQMVKRHLSSCAAREGLVRTE